MDVIDAIHRRRSVRSFTPEPIDDAVLLRLIDAAVWAPSAVNEQPCHFTVVQDRQKLEAISRQAKTHMLATLGAGIPGDLRAALSDPDFQIFHNAPTLILISADPGRPEAIEDCALAAQNLMLAACAEGLGTCWIGSAEGWLQTREGKALLGLPAASMPVAPIIVGHPASQPPPPPRRQPRIKWVRSTPPELSALQKKDANARSAPLRSCPAIPAATCTFTPIPPGAARELPVQSGPVAIYSPRSRLASPVASGMTGAPWKGRVPETRRR